MIFIDLPASDSKIEMQQWKAKQAINAAILNVSGRQRMLSQRIAMLLLRWACCQDDTTRQRLRDEVRKLAQTMEASHQGLIQGSSCLNLPGNPSPSVRAMYFEEPWQVDFQVRHYLQAVQNLLQLDDAEVTPQNPNLQRVVQAASEDLLPALDAVVNQYQRESEAEQALIAQKQIELYQQRCEAAAEAQKQATQLQATLAELHQIQSKLLQTEKMSSLGQLVAGIAHEINNPINFISANINHAEAYVRDLLSLLKQYETVYPDPHPDVRTKVDAIELEFVRSDINKLLQSMKTGSERIRKIVASLRTFARTDEADYKTINLHDGLDSALLILRHRLSQSLERPAIEVRCHYDKLPPIECYAGQLNQVFLNILNNALDALNERDKRRSYEEIEAHPSYIEIHTSVLDEEWVQVTIADNGIGMPESHRARMFDPFFTTKPVGRGTGLGLSVSYQIIHDLHGGKIDCFSTLGVGTKFIIQIPRCAKARPLSVS